MPGVVANRAGAIAAGLPALPEVPAAEGLLAALMVPDPLATPVAAAEPGGEITFGTVTLVGARAPDFSSDGVIDRPHPTQASEWGRLSDAQLSHFIEGFAFLLALSARVAASMASW